MNKKTLSPEKQKKFESMITSIEDLPTLPHVVLQLMDKLNEPDPSVDDLADMIMSDQVLTARMLRFVNSAYFGFYRMINSVKETILYLGVNEIRNMIYSAVLTNTFERDAPLIKRVRFWEHSLGCALFSKFIAQRIGYPAVEMAYLGGLLHDIGEAILALHKYKEFEQVVFQVLDHGSSFYDAEEAILGINHTDFGPWLSEHWLLPPQMNDVISFHHSVFEVDENKTLVALVRIADLTCLHYDLDFGYKEEDETLTGEIVELWEFLKGEMPHIAKMDVKQLFKELSGQIDIVKKSVDKIFMVEGVDNEVPVD